MSRSALVTGATGFVGSHLVRQLLVDGWHVCAAVRSTARIDHLPTDHPSLRIATVDGKSLGFRDALLQAEVDTVFHLAAKTIYEHAPSDIGDLLEANVELGTHLLQGMVEADVERVVVASTMWCSQGEIDDEPVNLYAATKAALGPILGYFTAAHGIRAIVLDLGDNYGPNDFREKVVSSLASAALDGTTLHMSPGNQRLDLAHVSDVVRAFLVAADRFSVPSMSRLERYSVLTGETISLQDLVVQIGQLVGQDLDVVWGARNHRPREVMQANADAPRLPGWTPLVRLADGLRVLIDESSSFK